MTFIFDYEQFYEYYTDPVNINIENTTRPTVFYFDNDNKSIKKDKQAKSNNLSQYYIVVNGVKVYIATFKDKSTKSLLFIMPTEIGGHLFDFHYRFGFRPINPNKEPTKIDRLYLLDDKKIITSKKKQTRKRRSLVSPAVTKGNIIDEIQIDTIPEFIHMDLNEKVVFFHKTIQVPTNISAKKIMGQNKHQMCYFQNNTKIKNVRTILCVDENQKHMKMVFSTQELKQITEIMTRPFMNIPQEPSIKKHIHTDIPDFMETIYTSNEHQDIKGGNRINYKYKHTIKHYNK